MDGWLRQSTSQAVMIGPFLDKTDGVTEETALSMTGVNVQTSEDGAAFANMTTADTVTHDSDGWYVLTLSTGVTSSLGILVVKVMDPATHLPVWHSFLVIPANEYDSFVLGTDALDVEVASMAANVLTATAIATDAITAAKIAANAIGSSELATDAIDSTVLAANAANEIADALLDRDFTAHTTADTLGKYLIDDAEQSGDVFAQLPTLFANLSINTAGEVTVAGTVSANVVQISGDTTAADNMELDYDGTGYNKLNSTVSSITNVGVAARDNIADSLLDRSGAIESGITPRLALRYCAAAASGKISGAATTTVTIQGSNTSTDRIVATVDADGNRSAVTLS